LAAPCLLPPPAQESLPASRESRAPARIPWRSRQVPAGQLARRDHVSKTLGACFCFWQRHIIVDTLIRTYPYRGTRSGKHNRADRRNTQQNTGDNVILQHREVRAGRLARGPRLKTVLARSPPLKTKIASRERDRRPDRWMLEFELSGPPPAGGRRQAGVGSYAPERRSLEE
jgi:hypothetical protein